MQVRANCRRSAKERTLSIGGFPAVGLAEARERREQAKKQIYNSDLRSGPASVGSGEGGLK